MKKTLLLILFLGKLCSNAWAQDCNADFLGTKTLYKTGAQKYTLAPAGYAPVFINHLNRHGARHLTKDVKTTSAYALLSKADSLNMLTEKGKALKQMVIALQKVEKGNTKNISAEGRDELRGIGRRMFANYSNVFGAKPNLQVTITKEVRTEQSADAFLAGLEAKMKDSAVIKRYNDDVHLRFYDLSPAYKRFENDVDETEPKLSLEKAADIAGMSAAFTGQFFEASFLKAKSAAAQEKFMSDIFGFATIVYSLKAEAEQVGYKHTDLDFKSFFTCEQLTKLGALDSIDENLKKGPGTDNDGIQVRIAAPLLVDFINTADDFTKTKKYNASLRFAHAETVSPFATLINIEGADKASKDPAKLDASWQASNVIPLSSNVQWIFYSKKGMPGYLVKVLLNEREVHITGLAASSFPYYKWSALRALYLAKLSKYGVKLTDDMSAFLTGLK